MVVKTVSAKYANEEIDAIQVLKEAMAEDLEEDDDEDEGDENNEL